MGRKLTFGKKELKALYATYGDANLYNSGAFEPLTRNLTTGASLKRGHHCDFCQRRMSVSCYEKLHYAFCSTWVTRKGRRERCGERFCVLSGGCGKHPRVEGYNKPLHRAANGEVIDISEFADPEPLNLENGAEEDIVNYEEWEVERDEVAEKLQRELGHVPETFYTDYYIELSKQKVYEQQNEKALVVSRILEEDEAIKLSLLRHGKTGKACKSYTGKRNKVRHVAIAEPPLLPIPSPHGRSTNGRLGGLTYGGVPSTSQATTSKVSPLRSFDPRKSIPKPQNTQRSPIPEESGIEETKQVLTKKFKIKKFFGNM
jgi:hypothetical protein